MGGGNRSAALSGVLLCLSLSCGIVSGMDLGSERLRLSGFGTLGLTRAGDEVLGYRRDISRKGVSDGQWAFEPDTLLGLQLDARLTQDLDATLQLVARDRQENTLAQSLEWAFLRYRAGSDLTIRAGRLGVDLFMLSEYRNVGFAYLWARPPVEFYGPIAFAYYDGADVGYTTSFGDGVFQVKLFAGRTENVIATETGNSSVKLKPIFGGSLSWESERWQARLGAASMEFDSSIEYTQYLQNVLDLAADSGWPEAAAISESLDSKGKRLNYFSAGISYDEHPWVVQSEISFIDSDYDVFLPLLSTYISVGHRFGPVTLFGVAALAKNTEDRILVPDAPQPPFTPIQQGAQYLYDLSYTDQRTLSLGLRWDIRHDLALKAQWDHHWVKPYGGALWIQNQVVTHERELDTFSINLNFVF